MRKTKANQSSKIQHRVPNNPAYDRQAIDPDEIAAENNAINRTLYDSSYKNASGHWKQSDEPDEAEQLRQSDRIQQMLQSKRQQASRERQKQKPGGVPMKSGRKLFDEFMKEASQYRPQKMQSRFSTKDLAHLRNLYNAASALDFDKWVIFASDTLISA
jgi:hypothetical protein